MSKTIVSIYSKYFTDDLTAKIKDHNFSFVEGKLDDAVVAFKRINIRKTDNSARL